MMRKNIQRTIQVAFLALFAILLIKGKVQAWMGLLLLGIAASFIFGRVYCGWVCSINTVLTGIIWIKKKLRLKSLPIPKFLLKFWVRYLMLGLFVAVFTFTAATGKRLPVLPVLFVIGILITLVYPKELWHLYLCPYGTMLKTSSSSAKRGMHIDEGLCNNCGACRRVCPAKAVDDTGKKHRIEMSDCLVCMECEANCKSSAIGYK